MVVRVLHAIGILALIGAGITLGLCALRGTDNGNGPEQVQSPSMPEIYRDALKTRGESTSQKISPLVREAQALADSLNPKPVSERTPSGKKQGTGNRGRTGPPVAPSTLSPSFRVQGTAYYASQPETSMALISMGVGQVAEQRWVKEGAVVGHFVVQEIRPNAVMCRRQNSEEVLEMSVEAGPGRPSVVQRYIPELVRAKPSGASTAVISGVGVSND